MVTEGLIDKNLKKLSINYLRQTIAECSSPHAILTTGSFRMKKCDAILSANRLRPSVKTAPVSNKNDKNF